MIRTASYPGAAADTARTVTRPAAPQPVAVPAGRSAAGGAPAEGVPAEGVPAADPAAPRPLTAADSTAGGPIPAADSVAADSAAEAALPRNYEPVPMTAAEPWRDVAPEELFGAASTLHSPGAAPAPATPTLTDNAVFQGFVLLLAATFAMLLHRHACDIRLLLGRISHDRASGKRLMEDPGGSGMARFLHISTAIGILFVGVLVVKYGDTLLRPSLLEALPREAVLALSLVASLLFIGVILYQQLLLRLAGTVTVSQQLIAQLLLLKRTYFVLMVIVSSPALLLFALCPRGTGGFWFSLIIAGFVLSAALYLRESLHLFLSKKISILHWILYLCTVELFPVSLLWIMAGR